MSNEGTETPQSGGVDLSCRSCGAPDDEIEPQFAENGQYKWSTCQKCGAKHLPNGLVEV